MFNVLLHPDAEREFREAFIWYEHQRLGLGKDFLFSIDEAIERILQSPEAFPVIRKGIRRVVVRRFPFEIFYEPAPEEIRVIAIFHSSRDPKTWHSRK